MIEKSEKLMSVDDKITFYNCMHCLSLCVCPQAVLFVYDITNQSTFDNLEDWWETVNASFKRTEPNSMPCFALVANKG